MAIGTDAAIDFFGTQDTVSSSSSAITDASFSVAADVVTWTNDDDAQTAAFVLTLAFSVAPNAGSTIALFAAPQNIDGANDQLDPSDAFQHVTIGVFPVKDVTSSQSVSVLAHLPNTKTSQEYLFFLKNSTGQTISASWDLKVTPMATGPHA